MADYVCKGQDFKVLDHGYIKIIDWMGSDEAVIEAARMSTGKGFQGWGPGMRCKECGWRDDDIVNKPHYIPHSDLHLHVVERVSGDMNLLDYLWRNHHTSPFEMCELHIEVNAPVLVWRQWMRHRTQSYNEASARYSKMSEDHYLPDPERVQAQGKKNKQGSDGKLDPLAVKHFLETCELQQKQIYESYEFFIEEDGIANETARLNSPVSRYSKARVKTDLKNWLGMLQLRMHPHAQWEIRMYAETIGNEIIAKVFPRVWQVFQEHTLYGTHFSRTEMGIIQSLIMSLENRVPDLGLEKTMAEEAGLKDSVLEEFLKKLYSGGQEIL